MAGMTISKAATEAGAPDGARPSRFVMGRGTKQSRTNPMMVVSMLVLLASLAFAANTQEAAPTTFALKVDGLACPFCTYGIEKQLSKISGLENIDIDIETGTITLTMSAGASLEELTAREAVEAAGFSLRQFTRVK